MVSDSSVIAGVSQVSVSNLLPENAALKLTLIHSIVEISTFVSNLTFSVLFAITC